MKVACGYFPIFVWVTLQSLSQSVILGFISRCPYEE